MSKKSAVVFFILLILLLIAGGAFWWWLNSEKPSSSVSFPKEEDFIIENSSGTKIIKNQKEGFEAKVPNGWVVEKKFNPEIQKIDEELPTNKHWYVTLSSPNVQRNGNKLTSGCGVNITIQYSGSQFKFVQNYIADIKNDPDFFQAEKEHYGTELLEVGHYTGFKEILFNNEFGIYSEFKIPVNNKVYLIETISSTKDQEICSQIFSDFLKTISIK